MQILIDNELGNLEEYFPIAKKKICQLEIKLREKYGMRDEKILGINMGNSFADDISTCLRNNVGGLARVLKLMKLSFGKRFLELGCGGFPYSPDNVGNFRSTNWEPWLCRILNEVGYHVIGIDLGELDYESFECYGGVNAVDLRDSLVYKKIPDSSLDAVYLGLLFSGSPTLGEILDERKIKKHEFFENLIEDLSPKMKNNGIIYQHLLYKY